MNPSGTEGHDPRRSPTSTPPRAPRLRTMATVAAVAAGMLLAASPADAQYSMLKSVELTKRHAQVIQSSRLAQGLVTVSGTVMTAAPGLHLVKDEKAGLVHVLGASMSTPPKTRFEQIVFPGRYGTATVAYICACTEDNPQQNSDECGFQVDNNYASACTWEGDGEARCTCEPRVVIWGDGEEMVLTYAGDPVG